ncbi:hypothetical protein BD410DRAFT_827402 [Rickenella mellea]|uniref:Uncharacterized protein n=1 Tax=Rickenella mellea TaxID=50990 RepID=A0A4Y7QAV4_9AGAM|nr:hypothetical protein BD410DRAFT_827402 [Rickenella mellea]
MYECPLCYEQFGPEVKPMGLPCGHVFCEDDIGRIAESPGRYKCPTCRRPFTPGPHGNAKRLYFSTDSDDREALKEMQVDEAHHITELLNNLDMASDPSAIEVPLRKLGVWTAGVHGAVSKGVFANIMKAWHAMYFRVQGDIYLRDILRKTRTELDAMRKDDNGAVAYWRKQYDELKFEKDLAERYSQIRMGQLNEKLRDAENKLSDLQHALCDETQCSCSVCLRSVWMRVNPDNVERVQPATDCEPQKETPPVK